MRNLSLLVLFWSSSLSFANNVFDSNTGELYLPVITVGSEFYEVFLQHQGELTFSVRIINSAGRDALQDLRRKARLGEARDIYDLATGTLALPKVEFGDEFYDVTMSHQGSMVFSVTSAIPLENDDTGGGDGSDDGRDRDRVTNPPDTADYVVTAIQSAADGENVEVNMPYVKLADEYYEVDLLPVDDVTYEVKAVSSPLNFRSAPADFNTYDPLTGTLLVPGLQIGSDLFEVTMEHLGNLVFTVSASKLLANDLDDGSDEEPVRGRDRRR